MYPTSDRLLALRVSDVMNRAVIQVSAGDTMVQAAEHMLNNQVSGAPVVDADNRCVGMISAIDFMRRERPDRNGGNPSTVEKNMSKGVKTIEAGASIGIAAQTMCRNRVHRLPVLDSAGRVIGIVSSLDIVAAVMNTLEEQKDKVRPKQ